MDGMKTGHGENALMMHIANISIDDGRNLNDIFYKYLKIILFDKRILMYLIK